MVHYALYYPKGHGLSVLGHWSPCWTRMQYSQVREKPIFSPMRTGIPGHPLTNSQPIYLM